MYAENFAELSSFIQKKIEKESLQEKTLQKVPKRKWKINRFSLYSLIGLVIPAIIYIIFISFFKLPEQEAYVSSSQAFLRSEEHTSELQSRGQLVCRLLLEKKKTTVKR